MADVTQRAVMAGNDVLLMPTDVPTAIDAVVAGVRDGKFTEARVDGSVRKLLIAKHQLGLDRQRYVDVEAVRRVVADSANIAAGRLAAERAITLVRDSLSLLPLGRMPKASRVVSLTIAPRAELSAGATFNAELQRYFVQLRTQILTPEIVFDATAGAASGGTGAYVASPVPRLLPAIVDNALRASEDADLVIVSSYFGASSSTATMSATGGLPELIAGLQKAGRRVVLVSFANPYLAQDLPATAVFVEAWSASPLSQRAAARALLGLAPITGQLPISIPSVAPYGTGLRRDVAPLAGSITP
jgi:beta-N-acetylhexosaminidase